MSAFSKGGTKISRAEFCKVFAKETKLIKAVFKINELTNKLKEKLQKQKRLADLVEGENKERQQIPKDQSNRRRNAIILCKQGSVRNFLNEACKEHAKVMVKLLESAPRIERINKLKQEIAEIRRAIIRQQVENDIERHVDYWRSVNSESLRNKAKLSGKVEAISGRLKSKYGEKAYCLIEYLTLQRIKVPVLAGNKHHRKILNSIALLTIQRNKEMKYLPDKFPYPIMAFHEVLLVSNSRNLLDRFGAIMKQ